MTKDADIVMQPMQWAELKDLGEVEPLSEADESLMRDLRDVLRKHGATERFGITLLHKHFDLMDSEVLLESTDVHARRLILHAVPGDHGAPSISTSWKFKASGNDWRPVTDCVCPWDPLAGRHSLRHEKG
jgi:hypothetical protein